MVCYGMLYTRIHLTITTIYYHGPDVCAPLLAI